MTMVAPYTQGNLAGYGCCGLAAYGRRRKHMMRGMGQSLWSDVTSLFSPTPGGGYVVTGTNSDGSQNVNYVDSTGADQTISVPAGQDVASTVSSLIPSTASYDASGLATAATSSIGSLFASVPTWVWLAGGVAAVFLLLGFSGVGKLIPQSRAATTTNRRRHTRRRSRSRR